MIFHLTAFMPLMPRFPTKEKVKNKWIAACQYSESDDVRNLHICSKHFCATDYCGEEENVSNEGRKRLLPSAVPSLSVPHQPLGKFSRFFDIYSPI